MKAIRNAGLVATLSTLLALMVFAPVALAATTAASSGHARAAAGSDPPPANTGYWLVAADGGVFNFNAPFGGSAVGEPLSKPVVGMAPTPDGKGYYLVTADGDIFPFGDAMFQGSVDGAPLTKPIVGMAVDNATGGYWLVAADGGIFSFNAPFKGSTGGIHLTQPVVGMAPTPDGQGYYLAAADGGIFTFGDATFQGSTGGIPLTQPVVGTAVDSVTGGYWLVAADGGIFTFNAPFKGSTGGIHLTQPVVGMAPTPDGQGYYLAAADGGIFTFGDAVFQGSTGGIALSKPVVGMAVVPEGVPMVTSISPKAGPPAGGTRVTITGTGLAGTAVHFGAAAATSVTEVSETELTAVSPPGTGTVGVSVTTPQGTSAATPAAQFTYEGPPTVTSVVPDAGLPAGGTHVTITGTNLTDATAVHFGTVAATSVVAVSATQVTAVSPPGTGTVSVTVTTPVGTSPSAPAGQFTYELTPTVTSLVPNVGLPAGGTMVAIHGTNLTDASAVHFGAVAATSVVAVSATEVTAVSPPGTEAEAVNVTVTTPLGPSPATPADLFTYEGLPTTTAITPTAGPLGGGTMVTITGTNLTGATAVTFGTTGVATNVTVISASQVTAVTPSRTTPTTVPVTVTTPVGSSAANPAVQFTYELGPTVISVVPNAGLPAGGTAVTITGTNLTGATAVAFGAVPAASFTAVSPTVVTAVSPAGTEGAAVNVTVTTPVGKSPAAPANLFTYEGLPTVTAITPTAGPTVGGTTVTITGTNLADATGVAFRTTAATSFTVVSATQVTAVSPARAAGTADVTVTTPIGTSITSPADHFTYVDAPTVTSITPTAGPDAGGTLVNVDGTHLTGATAVDFGGIPGTGVHVVSDTHVTVVSPAGGPGPVPVTVITPGGTSNANHEFTYHAPPTVTAIAPTSGPLGGGTHVTITGTNFTAVTAIDFGTAPAGSVVVVSPTEITVHSPSHAAGVVNVTVTNLGGVSAASPANQFTYEPAPTITTIAPTAGPVAGGTMVTITGNFFTGATAVDFAGVDGTGLVVTSATSLTVDSPPHSAGAHSVHVTTPGGTSGGTHDFTYVAAPTVTGIAPTVGPITGGTTVTITGTNLTGATAVAFGATAATSFVVDNSTHITAHSPPEAAGAVNVTVTTVGGPSTEVHNFTFEGAPTVTAVAPAAGPLGGGTVVTITGTGLTGTTAVHFGTSSASASTITVVSGTEVTVHSPSHTPAGTVNVTVTTPVGTSITSSLDQFTYQDAPTVTGKTPTQGLSLGGELVAIFGTNLLGTSAVHFGTAAATNITVINADEVTVLSPPHTPGTVTISVTTLSGTSSTNSNPARNFLYI